MPNVIHCQEIQLCECKYITELQCVDPVAQSVEHNTFNVESRVRAPTGSRKKSLIINRLSEIFLFTLSFRIAASPKILAISAKMLHKMLYTIRVGFACIILASI